MRSAGVRSWNIVWLGITKIMFAMPRPSIRPSAIGSWSVSPMRAIAIPAIE
jgi:hypothetical protein